MLEVKTNTIQLRMDDNNLKFSFGKGDGYKGYAAAISILIFAVIMLVTVIQMIGQKKWVNYD